MEAFSAKVDAWAARYIESERLPSLAVAIVRRGGEVVFRKGYSSGVQSLTPVEAGGDNEDVYWIASNTKIVTAVAALQLHEAGLWELDDPVSKFLPEFLSVPGVHKVDQGDDESDELDPVQQPITMRMLLTHTSGISYSIIPFLSDGRPNPACEGYNDHVDKGKTLAEVVQGIARQPLVAQPGTQWNYSMGLEVVGRVIEVLSGKPIDVYFSEHIFDPLGMKSTQFIQRAPPTLKARRLRVFGANQGALSKDRQQFYSDDFAGPKMIELPASAGGGQGSALLPGGGLLSTVGDWTKFVNALLEDGGGILRPESVALMTSAQLPPACKGGPAMHLINGKSEEDATYTMGLGGAVGGPGERQLFEWGGVTSTVMWVDRAAGFGVVCFTQLLTSMVYPIRSELKDIVYASTLFGESQTARDVSKHPNTENKL